MPDVLAWLPPGVVATVALSASSVLLGFGLPLAAGLAVLGLVRGFVELRWREFVLGMLLVVALVAAGVALRVWGQGLVAGESLGAANATAAFVFTAVTPFGVILGCCSSSSGWCGGMWGGRGLGLVESFTGSFGGTSCTFESLFSLGELVSEGFLL